MWRRPGIGFNIKFFTWIKYFLVGCFSLIGLTISAQNEKEREKPYFILGSRLHYGFIIAHTKSIKEAAESNPIGIQVDLNWHFASDKAYNYCNCYPRLGLSLYYWDFMNDEILGQGFNIQGFAEPFIGAYHRLSFSFRPAFGLSFLNNPYHPEKNPENLCYSTRVSFVLLVNATMYFKITRQFLVNMSMNYNHVSNGGIKIPNKGLNYPSFSFGLEYAFSPLNFRKHSIKDQPEYNKKNRAILITILGFKGLQETDKTYLVKGIIGQYGWQIGRQSIITGGMEFVQDDATKEKSTIYPNLSSNSQYEASLTVGYKRLLGKFSLTFDLGGYVYYPDRMVDLIYQRYGAAFHINDHFFTGISIKAHRHVADFFDVRVGYIF
ncbi:MAG: acyloxyacyl hydrolase [Bacteroidales bacterium]|nr:acyloxyacyl hydrolase [Bacteroidales bacterium]